MIADFSLEHWLSHLLVCDRCREGAKTGPADLLCDRGLTYLYVATMAGHHIEPGDQS